jgi:CheY-like chemotaxis protein
MPNMDGVDVLKNIRKKENELGISNGSKTHVVMASGVENKDVKEVCYEQGCSYYFEKPLNLSHVGILIKSIISERMK